MPEWKDEIRKRLANLKLAPTCETEIVEELKHSQLLEQEPRRVKHQVHRQPVILDVRRWGNAVQSLPINHSGQPLRRNLLATVIAVREVCHCPFSVKTSTALSILNKANAVLRL